MLNVNIGIIFTAVIYCCLQQSLTKPHERLAGDRWTMAINQRSPHEYKATNKQQASLVDWDLLYRATKHS